ncbi:MAG: ATP-binding protein [Actinomycetia bacterium]|nr:ATP-binding protein [Actinomycetes bacterium]
MTASLPPEIHRAIKVGASTACLAEIRRFVEEVGVEVALDLERIFDLKVAVSEACANAVEHAGCDAMSLDVCARLQARRLTFTVTDTGLFRPPSPRWDRVSSRGLGLPLMVALMDEVTFVRTPGGGTAVSLSVLLDRDMSPPA